MKIHLNSNAKLNAALITLLLIILNLSNASAENLSDTGLTVQSQDNTKVELNYSIGEFTLSDIEIDGEFFQNINLPGHFLPNDAGAPNLPGSGRYIAVPRESTVSIKILSYKSDTLSDVKIAPSFRIPKDNEKGPLEYTKNESIYSADKFFPEEPFILSDKDIIRGIDVVMLGITPFQYNPVKQQLIVYKDIKIEIAYEGGTGTFGDEKLRSRWWDPILSDMLLNFESLPKVDYNKSFQSKDDTGCEYLIITPNNTEFQVWADSIKDFRTTQGIYTNVVTLDEIGGNTASSIEGYINNAYNTWEIVPAACLLLGDYGNDASNRIISPLWENYCVSDNIYADVDGNDLPDIILARITARDELELEVMVTKFLHYESDPPVDEDFYNHPVTSLGWQTDSWFQLCSEVIGGFWREVQGKEPIRINEIYSGIPGSEWSTADNTEALVNYFGPSGLGYIPESPSELGGWSGGTADMVNTAIDSGIFMVQHRDHGIEEGWSQPSYTKTDINNLLNTELTFMWSVNSLTGKFNSGIEVFAEKLHRYTYKDENSGCFGINAASEITYSFVSDVYVWGAYDNMWPDFMPAFGSTPEPRGVLPAFACASGKYFLEQSAWPYNPDNKAATYHLFHHHGDAFSTVYSEVPQNLTVSHNSILYLGETIFDVTADVDALIGLSVNGELIGTATGTGTPVSITIPAQTPPDQLLVTVTKQNYYRYEAYADVLPATGAYVVYNEVEINDESGNGNGIMETSETILASITVKNVGVEDAENISVTISTTDPYINITDDNENYGSISAGNLAVIPDAFSWEVADNIPDLHIVVIELTVTDGTLTWTSDFSLTGHGPLLKSGTILIDDYIGNWNGRLDPGETAFLIVQTINNGSYIASSTIGSLSCSNEYVTLNNTTFNFYDIGPGITEEGIFEVIVSDEAPAGEYVELFYEVNSGGYSFQQYYTIVVSPLVEDWETGDMSQFEWETGGDSDWELTAINAYEGSYSIKSGTIAHSESNYLSLPFNAHGEDSLSFWCRVSSEIGYDFLKFYIDDVEISSWSGEVAWERSSYLLTEGSHILKWTYSKDASSTSGEDCAWVDFILFPIFDFDALFSSSETNICEGESISFYDESQGEPNSWEWTFEGGTPETSIEQNPVIEYFNSGIYEVTLIVSNGASSDTLVLENYITVSAEPEIPPTPIGPESMCAAIDISIYNTTGIVGISVYDWFLDPPEAGVIDGTGLEISVNWVDNYMGQASLIVAGVNDCGTGDFSDPVIITRYLPEVSLEPFEIVCINSAAFELIGGMPEGGEYSGSGVDNGWFNPSIAGLGTHTISYTYTDANSCENSAVETIFVDPCTGIGENNSESEINIYPNPTTGIVYIDFDKDIGSTEIVIVNTLNKVIYSETAKTNLQNKLKIDLSNHSKGIYTIILKSEKKEERLKVILK